MAAFADDTALLAEGQTVQEATDKTSGVEKLGKGEGANYIFTHFVKNPQFQTT